MPSRVPLHRRLQEEQETAEEVIPTPPAEMDEMARKMANAPPDRFNFTYFTLYLLGCTSLLPWNFILMAEDYWLYKFRNVTANGTSELTPRQAEMQANLTMASALPTTIFLILNAIIGHRFRLNYRMISSFIAMTLLMAATAVFVKVDTDSWQDEFFQLTILIVISINGASSIASGSLFGVAGQFPSQYMTSVVSGQALGGILAAVFEIAIIAFGAKDAPATNAFLYFNVGTAALFLSTIAYRIMSKSTHFRYFRKYQKMQSAAAAARASSDRALLLPENAVGDGSAGGGEDVPVEPSLRVVLGKVWVYALSEWLVCVATLSIYPGFTVLVRSQDHGSGSAWTDIYFTPVCNYLLFNVGDYFGRILAGVFERPRHRPMLVAFLSLARVLLVPVLAVCNSHPRHSLPVLIHSDAVFVALMAVLALSNGYLTNIPMIYAPKSVTENEKEMASSILAASLGIGLACGSMMSFLLVALI